MKKMITVLLICLFAVSCGTTGTGFNNMSSLYSTRTGNVDDIRGQSTLTSMLIAKDGSMAGWAWLLTLNKFEQNNQTLFIAIVEYNANNSTGWAFIDEFLIRVDDQLFTVRDNNPNRRVVSGGVSEVAHFSLDETILGRIKTASSIVIQFYGKPVNISEEGINAIGNFVNNT